MGIMRAKKYFHTSNAFILIFNKLEKKNPGKNFFALYNTLYTMT